MALTIGKVANVANVHVETLRYYERRGLVPKHQEASPCIGAILKALCVGFGSSGTRRRSASRCARFASCCHFERRRRLDAPM